jgi:hypothetical protein
VFAGNRADVSTVEDSVRAMETKYGQAERIWVMDRGMVSAANIAFLRQRKARYLVGTPKSWLRAHEQTLLEQSDWKTVQDGLEVRLARALRRLQRRARVPKVDASVARARGNRPRRVGARGDALHAARVAAQRRQLRLRGHVATDVNATLQPVWPALQARRWQRYSVQ